MICQMPFSLTYTVQKTEDDFLVSSCNKEAFSWIKKNTWSFPMIMIIGDEGSGKTHLAHIFSSTILKAKNLKEIDIPFLPRRASIEDIDEFCQEKTLFHLFNYASENKSQILMTARAVPLFKLPDLKTRVNSIPIIQIHAPDDTLMMALLCKAFTERHVDVDSDVISYLMTHLNRSYKEIHQIVSIIDAYALSLKRRITIPLIKQALIQIQKEKLI